MAPQVGKPWQPHSYSYMFRGYAYMAKHGAEMREEDRAKFVRLATKRVSNALKSIRLIGNLANKSNYDYTEEDVKRIFKALSDELGACRKKFELAQERQSGVRFSLE